MPPGRDYDGIIRVLGTLSKGQHKTLDEFYQVWKNSGITAVEFMNKRLYKEFDHKLGLSETVKQMLVVHDPSKAQFYPTK